jgi:hypothetical protein
MVDQTLGPAQVSCSGMNNPGDGGQGDRGQEEWISSCAGYRQGFGTGTDVFSLVQ